MGQKLITFKYNGEIYKSQNLEKRLKKLNITRDDIEIIPEEIKESQQLTNPNYIYYFNKKTHHTILVKVDDFTYPENNKLTPYIWNEKLKTGIKDFAINDWVMLKGKPEYPIILGADNLPVLEMEYNWTTKIEDKNDK